MKDRRNPSAAEGLFHFCQPEILAACLRFAARRSHLQAATQQFYLRAQFAVFVRTFDDGDVIVRRGGTLNDFAEQFNVLLVRLRSVDVRAVQHESDQAVTHGAWDRYRRQRM